MMGVQQLLILKVFFSRFNLTFNLGIDFLTKATQLIAIARGSIEDQVDRIIKLTKKSFLVFKRDENEEKKGGRTKSCCYLIR